MPAPLNSLAEELRRHTTLVVEAAAARISDSDAAVRAAARELLEGTLLPALGGHALAPFLPLFMAHVCAAMTHLADQIRFV
jgi:pre-rRNA-processing protein IPI1